MEYFDFLDLEVLAC